MGRAGLQDSRRREVVLDWRAPLARAFYQVTVSNPMGLVRRRHIDTRRRRVTLLVLKGEAPTFTDNEEQITTFTEVYENRSKPLPLVPAEDQFESTVGQAMNDMFARIATGTVLTSDDVKTALASAQDTVSAAIG